MKFFLTCGFLILAVFLCVSFQASAQARGTVNFTIVVSENHDDDNTPVSSASVSVRPDGHNTDASPELVFPDYSAFETDIFSHQPEGAIDLIKTDPDEEEQYVVTMEFN